jgi:hypothetical protein
VCSGTPDNACIGLEEPEGQIVAPVETIYYNRSNAVCYENIDGHDSWVALSGVSGGRIIGGKHRLGQLAPLVNISQEDAKAFCQDSNNNIQGILGFKNFNDSLESKLPSRLEQISYSFYHPSLSDVAISALETGLSLNATPKCNTSKANGLENDYSDTNVPDSNTYHTLPGSFSSNIRSLITGSDETDLCISTFGVQDHVGNIAEFTLDRIKCPKFSVCPGVLFGDPLSLIKERENYFTVPSDPSAFDYYSLDGIRGPCVDSDADGICDGVIGSWAIQEQNFGAGRMALPMGIPIQVDFPVDFPNSSTLPYLLEIGPTNGITSAQLHEDVWTFNNHHIWSSEEKCGSMSAGGNYIESNGAGQFSFKFLTCDPNTTSYLVLGSEMAIRALDNQKWTIELKNPRVANSLLSLNVTANKVVFDLATDSDSMLTTTYAQINTCLKSPLNRMCNCTGNCNMVMESVIFDGITTSSVAAPLSPTELIDLSEDALNEGPETGFRCVTPIDYSLYSD